MCDIIPNIACNAIEMIEERRRMKVLLHPRSLGNFSTSTLCYPLKARRVFSETSADIGSLSDTSTLAAVSFRHRRCCDTFLSAHSGALRAGSCLPIG